MDVRKQRRAADRVDLLSVTSLGSGVNCLSVPGTPAVTDDLFSKINLVEKNGYCANPPGFLKGLNSVGQSVCLTCRKPPVRIRETLLDNARKVPPYFHERMIR